MKIETEARKGFISGQRVIVTCSDPTSKQPNFGSGNIDYPVKGWTGTLRQERRNGFSSEDYQWSIIWDKSCGGKSYIGDLVWEWQIDALEWNLEENEVE